jgi:uncharacterized protein YdhG (YjbR/CyaY superfamily)
MPAKNVDAYLASVKNPEQFAALQKLRQSIQKIVPKAEETISYGLPAFALNGKAFAAFAAAKAHCSFYPMSGSIIQRFSSDLKGFKTSKGSIHFQPDNPIPASLLRRLLKARLAQEADKD